MTDLTLTQANIRPLLGTVVRPYQAGGAVEVGDAVFIAADGDVELADADAAASARVIGVIVACGAYGKLTAVDGDRVDVCLYGPVVGFAGITPGDEYFASTTAGSIEDTAPAGSSGDYRYIVGRGEVDSAGQGEYTLFVKPYTDDPAAQ